MGSEYLKNFIILEKSEIILGETSIFTFILNAEIISSD